MSSGTARHAFASVHPPAARITQRIEVQFEYPIVFTDQMLDPSNHDLLWCLSRPPHGAGPVRIFTVVDAGVAEAWPDLADRWSSYFAANPASVHLCGAPREVPAGEAAKNDPSVVANLRHDFAQARLDRHAIVVAIGGGAVLDAVGYAAATTHRGIRLLRVPTTVLAQNDAGIGVKNGINGEGVKNFVGTFAPPMAVLCDAQWLATLSTRDRRAGIAEAVKVALIRDAQFFDWLERNHHALAHHEPATEQTMIRRCAELHLEHIGRSGDPFESGSARPLDFGHWSAHKLEQWSGHTLRHGEAVSIGMALDVCMAQTLGWLSSGSAKRIVGVLRALGLPTWHEALGELDAQGRPRICEGLEDFREHIGGDLDITLVTDIGASRSLHEVSDAAVAAGIEELRRHQAAVAGVS